MNVISAALAACPLFCGLSPQALAGFAVLAARKDVDKGQMIFLEGDTADMLYLTGQGKIKIFRSSPDGREVVLHLFGPGDMFGEVAVLQGGAFPASAQALEASRLITLPRRHLLAHLGNNPMLALNMMGALCARLRSFSAKIEALALLETPQRLAAYLLHESELRDGAKHFRLDVSKGLLAAMLGTARETLSRCLARMAEQGAVQFDGRDIHIVNHAYLENLVKGLEKL